MGFDGVGPFGGLWHSLATSMVTHAGLWHLLMNLGALLSLSPLVVARLGRSVIGVSQYVGLLVGAGLAACLAYLALNLQRPVPVVGASGAICGLAGFTARVSVEGKLGPLGSRTVGRQVLAFAKVNAFLFVLIYVTTFGRGSLAWEAHLGGFLFGLLTAPAWRLASENDAGEGGLTFVG